MSRKNYFIFLGILSLMTIFPMERPFSYTVDTTQTVAWTFPLEIGAWKGQDAVLDESTYEILETRNVLSRIYENQQGKKIHLLIVSSDKDRRVAHPPEVCFISSNYSILDQEDVAFSHGKNKIGIRSFLAKDERNARPDEKVFYVYKVGKLFTTNYYAQQAIFAWNQITRREGLIQLIRLSGQPDCPFQEFFSSVLQYLS